MSIHTDDLRDIADNYGWSVCDSAADEIDCLEFKLSTAEAQLAEATDSIVMLREALEKVASSDFTMGAPVYVLEAHEALSATSRATSAAVERIREEEREKCWQAVRAAVEDGPVPGNWQEARAILHDAILNRADGEK